MRNKTINIILETIRELDLILQGSNHVPYPMPICGYFLNNLVCLKRLDNRILLLKAHGYFDPEQAMNELSSGCFEVCPMARLTGYLECNQPPMLTVHQVLLERAAKQLSRVNTWEYLAAVYDYMELLILTLPREIKEALGD